MKWKVGKVGKVVEWTGGGMKCEDRSGVGDVMSNVTTQHLSCTLHCTAPHTPPSTRTEHIPRSPPLLFPPCTGQHRLVIVSSSERCWE
jgi:hypothetical protein